MSNHQTPETLLSIAASENVKAMQNSESAVNWRSFKANLKLLADASHPASCRMSLFLVHHALLHGDPSEAQEAFDALHWSAHHNLFPVTTEEHREIERLYRKMPGHQVKSA